MACNHVFEEEEHVADDGEDEDENEQADEEDDNDVRDLARGEGNSAVG